MEKFRDKSSSRFSAFIAHVSVQYVNTFWTQALKIFPFMWYDAPWAVGMGDSSSNIAQDCRTLALAALVHTFSCTQCVTQISQLWYKF